MSRVIIPNVFTYRFDSTKTLKEHMKQIEDHMNQLGVGTEDVKFEDVRLTLELPTQGNGMDVSELKDSMDEAFKSVQEEMDNPMIPVAVDNNGNPLFQKKNDII